MTDSQFQALVDIEKHGNPWYRVHGQSQHGGWNGVMRVITRNDWARSGTHARAWTLTDAGKEALKKEKARRR